MGYELNSKLIIGQVNEQTNAFKVLKVGDEVMITGPTTGYVETIISEIRVDNQSTKAVKKGDVFSFPIDIKIRPSDKLYKLHEPIK